MQFVTNLFDQANALLVSYLGDLGPLIAAGALGLLLVLVALPSILFKKKDPLDRIKEMRLGSDNRGDSATALRRGGKDERLDRFAQYLEPQDQAEYSAAQMTLVRAGYGGLSVGQVQAKVDLPASTLSHHLKRLIDQGLVRQERAGTSLICHAEYDAMNTLLGFLSHECCMGDVCPPAPGDAAADETSPA